MKLAPSLLSADFSDLTGQVKQLEEGNADYLHLDVMDGHFVPNLTFGPLVVATCRRLTQLPLDVHLMIEKPEQYLAEYQRAGSDYLSVHVETCPHLHRTIQQIRALGCHPGIAINPATPLASVEQLLGMVDRIVLMSVNPGFSGQKFIETTFKKLEQLNHLRKSSGLNFDIEIDGGVDPSNIKKLVGLGADVLVAGSSVFNNTGTIKENIATLRTKSSS